MLILCQGHEGCGTVLDVGSEARGFKKGDEIGWLPIVDCCFDCDACKVCDDIKACTCDAAYRFC